MTFNVRWVIVTYVALFACTACIICQTGLAVADEGFHSLFDGQTLDGWEGNPKLWSVQNGAITGQTTQQNNIGRSFFAMTLAFANKKNAFYKFE